MYKKVLLSLFLSLFTFVLNSQALDKHSFALPAVKQTVMNFVIKDRSSTESYQFIKDISLSAVKYIKTDGLESSKNLDRLIEIVSVRLKKSAIKMRKKDIVATIVTAINS